MQMSTSERAWLKDPKQHCMTAAQVHASTEHRWIVQLQRVNFLTSEFYLNKVAKIYTEIKNTGWPESKF